MSSDSEDKPLLFDAGLAAAPLTTDANVEDEEKAEVDPPGAENYDQDLFSAETQAVERPVSESDETDDEMLNQQTQALEPAGADNSEERDLFAADTQAAPIYVSDSDETDDELFNMQTQAAPIVVSDEESGDQPSTSAHSKANSQNMSTTSRTKEGQVKITHVTVSDSDETDDEMFNMQTQAAPIIISDEESEPKPPEAESVDDVFKMGAKSNKKCSSSTNTSLDVSRPAHDASADTVLLEKSADSTPPRRKSRPTLLLMRDSPDLMASSINVMSGKNSSSLNIVDDSVEESHDGDMPGSPDIFNMSTQVADVHVPSSDSDQDEVIAAETPDVSFVGTKSANNRRVNGQAEGELDSDELFVAQTQPAFEDVLEDVVADVAPGEPEINSPTNEIVSTTLAIGDVTSTPGGDKDAVDSATSKTNEVNGGPAVDSVAVEVNGEPAVKSGRNRRGRPGKSDVVKEQPKDVSNSLDDLLAEVGESRRSKSERKVSFAPDTPQQEVGETLMKRTRQKPLRYRQPATPCDAASLEVPTSTQAKETELVQTPDPNTSSTEPVSISSPLTSTHPHSPDQPHKSGKPELVPGSHLTSGSNSRRFSERKKGKVSADAVEVEDSSQPSPPKVVKVKDTEPASELPPAPAKGSRTRRAGKRKTGNKSSDVEMTSSTTATSLSSPTKDADSIPAPSTQPGRQRKTTKELKVSVVGISSSSQGSSSSAESARTPSVTTVSTGTQTPTTRRTRRGRRAEPIATSSTTPESVAGSKRKRGRGLSSTCLDSPSKQSSSTQFMSVPSTPSRSTGSSPAKKPKKGRKIETIIEPVTEAETDITHDLEHTESHRSLRTPLVKVTFTGLAETQSLEKMAEQLGWTVTADMSKSTHVVADQVKRTIKFMCAVSRGLHIVTSQWVVESHKMNKCLDVAKYSLRDRKAEKLHGFNLESSLSWARSHPEGVLNGCKVFVSKNTQPPPEEIKELVTSAGGKIYKTLPKVAEKNLYVVSCDQDKRLYHRLMGEGHTVVSKEFVLSTILKQQLCVNEHKLK